jgi:hypothetical protein
LKHTRSIPLWMGLGIGLAVPLLPGCGLLAAKAISTGIGSTTDVEVSPGPVTMAIGQQQQFQARSRKIAGNPRITDADWSVEGGVGYVDSNGLFIATNAGQGKVRATKDVAAGVGNIVGKADVFVSPPPDTAPRIANATVTPASASAGSLLTFRASVQSSRGLAEVQRVVARELRAGLTVQMVDDGIHNGDTQANDGIYTGQITLPLNITTNQLRFGIHAEDFANPPNSSEWSWVTVNLGGTSS